MQCRLQFLRLVASSREAIERTLDIIREARAELGIDVSSSVNLFIANGSQLAAVRLLD